MCVKEDVDCDELDSKSVIKVLILYLLLVAFNDYHAELQQATASLITHALA